MKILFLQDDFPPESQGGAGFSTYELAQGMKEAQHDVSVITSTRNEDDAGTFEYEGLTIFRVVSNYPSKWRAYVSLYNSPVLHEVEKILRQVQPDVVHINNIHTHLSYGCFKLARKYGKAVVFTARDSMAFCYGKLETQAYLNHLNGRTTWRDHVRQAGKGYNPFRNLLIKRALLYADALYAVSDALRDALKENNIDRVETMHTGIDATSWYTDVDEIQQFKKKYGIESRKIILFGGRLSEGKGGKAALDALLVLTRIIPDVALLIVGTVDEYAKRMQKEARDKGIEKNIIFTDWMDRNGVRIANAVAHVVLVPSLYLDPFPRTAIEAMAAARPVVGTRYGGAPEIVVDGVTGYVVDPSNAEEVSAKIADLLMNPVKSSQFGMAGRTRINEYFNLKEVVEKYIMAYESILEKRH